MVYVYNLLYAIIYAFEDMAQDQIVIGQASARHWLGVASDWATPGRKTYPSTSQTLTSLSPVSVQRLASFATARPGPG